MNELVKDCWLTSVCKNNKFLANWSDKNLPSPFHKEDLAFKNSTKLLGDVDHSRERRDTCEPRDSPGG